MSERLPLSLGVAAKFDFDIGRADSEFVPFDLTEVCSKPFTLGIIVGPSGSGKSQALYRIGADIMSLVQWNSDYCVVDHFLNEDSALKALAGAGLNSVPQWMKPFHHLSNGEQYRAILARVLEYVMGLDDPEVITCVDEFTSVVDRVTARSLCESLTRFLSTNHSLILATCHYDVIKWLSPDWVLDTSTNTVEYGVKVSRPAWEVHVFDKVGEIRR